MRYNQKLSNFSETIFLQLYCQTKNNTSRNSFRFRRKYPRKLLCNNLPFTKPFAILMIFCLNNTLKETCKGKIL